MLLDDTVVIAGLKPARDEGGRLKLQRAYDFEYSDTGNNRLLMFVGVPEPSTLVLAGLATLVIGLRRRARNR